MRPSHDDGVSRRSAMDRILRFVALAGGLSLPQARKLLGAELKTVSRKTAPGSPTASALKLLKVKLSGHDKNVFVNEFGRLNPLVEIQPGMGGNPHQLGCTINFGGGIGDFAEDALKCPCMTSCTGNGCEGQRVGGPSSECTDNTCDGQFCVELDSCTNNDCEDQNCTSLKDCTGNKQKLVELLNQYSTDPYVQNLMNHFSVSTVNDLAVKVNAMIDAKRTITPQQLMTETPGIQTTPTNLQTR